MPLPTVVYVHGAGGGNSREQWLNPLNERLSLLGFSPIHGKDMRIVEPQYALHLRDPSAGEALKDTWSRQEERGYQRAIEEYEQRRVELQTIARRWAQDAAGGMGWAPTNGQVGAVLSNFVPDAKLYWNRRASREASWRAVYDAFPKTGHVIVIAHSLGSVVMADMLKRLPGRVTVDLLVTIGSPLAIDVFRKQSRTLSSDFPYDVVKAWVNIFDPADSVTIGRGISRLFPQAIDIPVELGGAHTLPAYCSHPMAANSVAAALYGTPVAPPAGKGIPSRQIAEAWDLQLLSYAFSNQLSRTFHTKEWLAKSRLDFARRASAQRLTREIGSGDTAVDPGTAPNEEDLLRHATDLIRDNWSDEALLPFLVSLFMSPPVRPFDINIEEQHRQRALEALLNRVRRRAGTLTDQEIAKAVVEAVEEAMRAMRDDGFPWEVLIGVGVVVLAATGVGLVAAVPAGLVGAAAVTSTLAAFGPGGMVGGMITLAALTGAGTAAAGAGVGHLLGAEETRDALLTLAASELAGAAPKELRVTVTGMLAVVAAQRPLGFTTSVGQVEAFLLQLRSALQVEARLHGTIAPDRPGTKDWQTKLTHVERALEWLEAWMRKHGHEVGNRLSIERRELLKEIEA